jgi:hypothetical protein
MRYVRKDFQFFGTLCHFSEMIVIGAGLVESYFANHAGHTRTPTAPKRPVRSKPLKGSKTPAETKVPAAKKSNSPRAVVTRSEPKWVALLRARKRRAQRRPQRSA